MSGILHYCCHVGIVIEIVISNYLCAGSPFQEFITFSSTKSHRNTAFCPRKFFLKFSLNTRYILLLDKKNASDGWCFLPDMPKTGHTLEYNICSGLIVGYTGKGRYIWHWFHSESVIIQTRRQRLECLKRQKASSYATTLKCKYCARLFPLDMLHTLDLGEFPERATFTVGGVSWCWSFFK